MAISTNEIAPFLSNQKLPASEVDTATIVAVEGIIYSRLKAAGFNTDMWTTVELTPPVVRTIQAMYTAGTYYNSVFSEISGDRNSYGTRLITQALAILGLVEEGAMSLGDEWDLPVVDGAVFETDPIFTIGRVF